MHTHGETIQLLEEQIKELQDRLRTSDEKLKASMGKNLMISEDRLRLCKIKLGSSISISRSWRTR